MCIRDRDRTQSEIADRYGISRPMVSKLLKEARDRGIVTIRINAPKGESGGAPSLMELVGRCFGIYDGVACLLYTSLRPRGRSGLKFSHLLCRPALQGVSVLAGGVG